MKVVPRSSSLSTRDACLHASPPVRAPAPVRCRCLRGCAAALLNSLKRSKRCGRSLSAECPFLYRALVTARLDPAAAMVTRISPSNVDFSAFDSRFSSIFSHISRSTKTGSGNGAQSTFSRSPARSTAERKTLASCAVSKRQIRRLVAWRACGPPRSAQSRADRSPASAVAARFAAASPRLSDGGSCASECVLNRTENQRERRAQFVAYVAEESRLGAIQLGQALRARLFSAS